MNQIKVRYKPLSFVPYIRTVNRYCPDNWNDVTLSQFKAFESLFLNKISDVAFISIMFGISKSIVKRCSDFERYSLLECLEFMKDGESYSNFVFRMNYRSCISIQELKSPLDIMADRQFAEEVAETVSRKNKNE
jgi:hypothetical protein